MMHRSMFILGVLAAGLLVQPAWSQAPYQAAPPPAQPAQQPDRLALEIQIIQQVSDPSAAVAAYARGAALDPANPQLLEAFVDRMVDFDLPEVAYHQAQLLVDKNPNSGRAWAVLAYVNARRGQMTEALTDIVQAASRQSADKFVQSTAGELLAWYDMDQPAVPDSLKTALDQVRQSMAGQAAYADAYKQASGRFQPATQQGYAANPPLPLYSDMGTYGYSPYGYSYPYYADYGLSYLSYPYYPLSYYPYDFYGYGYGYGYPWSWWPFSPFFGSSFFAFNNGRFFHSHFFHDFDHFHHGFHNHFAFGGFHHNHGIFGQGRNSFAFHGNQFGGFHRNLSLFRPGGNAGRFGFSRQGMGASAMGLAAPGFGNRGFTRGSALGTGRFGSGTNGFLGANVPRAWAVRGWGASRGFGPGAARFGGSGMSMSRGAGSMRSFGGGAPMRGFGGGGFHGGGFAGGGFHGGGGHGGGHR